MKKMILAIVLICLSFNLVSCTVANTPVNINNEQESEKETYVEYEIPEVFVIKCFYIADEEWEFEPAYFWLFDKNGDAYEYELPEGKNLTVEEAALEYMNGNLDEDLRLIKTISDKEGLDLCVKKLQGILNNDEFEYLIQKSEFSSNVEPTYCEEWYGLYYNENFELNKICLDKSWPEKNIGTSDKRAGNIVSWLTVVDTEIFDKDFWVDYGFYDED